MTAWPLRSQAQRNLSVARSASAVAMTTVTASATTHTKGAWTELIAATAGPVAVLDFYAYNTAVTATDTSTLLDIGIGAAGAEQVVIADIGVGYIATTVADTAVWRFPLMIPDGARIAARCQSVTASKAVSVALDTYGSEAFEGIDSAYVCDTFGAVSSTSRGLLLSPGATNVKGGWSEFTSSTPAALKGLALTAQGSSSTMQNANVVVDIGIGASGSEQVVWPDLAVRTVSTELMTIVGIPLMGIGPHIPAGSRLTGRIASSSTSQSLDVCLHGMRV